MAFGNHPNGGTLVFGIDDDGVPVGVDPTRLPKLPTRSPTRDATPERVSFYGAGAYGPNWTKPTDKQLLAIAVAPNA